MNKYCSLNYYFVNLNTHINVPPFLSIDYTLQNLLVKQLTKKITFDKKNNIFFIRNCYPYVLEM